MVTPYTVEQLEDGGVGVLSKLVTNADFQPSWMRSHTASGFAQAVLRGLNGICQRDTLKGGKCIRWSLHLRVILATLEKSYEEAAQSCS